MRTQSLLLMVLLACLPAAVPGVCSPTEQGHASLVPALPGGGAPNTSPRPQRKAVLDNENDQDDESVGQPQHLFGDGPMLLSLSWPGLMSGSWSIALPDSGSSSAPLYLTLRTLLI